MHAWPMAGDALAKGLRGIADTAAAAARTARSAAASVERLRLEVAAQEARIVELERQVRALAESEES